MKNISYMIAGAGLIGTMVGASALDGPDMAAGIAIMAAGLAALSAIGLKPENWVVYKEDSDYLYVVHKLSGRKRKIIKNAPGPENRKGHKNK